MLSAAFRRCPVYLQLGSMPMPIPGTTGGSFNIQNAFESEAKRRRELVDATKKRYVVVEEESRPKSGRVIGIDLGTTNSCICYIDPVSKKPKIIPSPTGSWVFPTAITFDKNHNIRLYGEEARACVRTSASATLCSGKRLIGRGFGELGRVHSELHKTNILTMNEKGEVAVEIMGRTYTIVHITAMFLRYLKTEAEKFLGEPVTCAVVSVPAYFTPRQKVATEDAALSAGFDVLEVIDEPSAACLTYTVLHRDHVNDEERGKRILRSLVFDLGGGTLDCAVMEHDQYRQTFKLVATHGDPLLGGNDWDGVISQHFVQQFERKWGVPIEEEGGNVGQGVATHRNLTLEAEKAKIHFTHSTDTYYGYNRAFHFSERLRDILPLEATLTHEDYVTLTRPLRTRCVQCLEKLFSHTHLKPEHIDNVLLVGAMTRDPPIRFMLEEYFGKPVTSEDTCPADYAVAIGAGIRGGMLQGDFPQLTSSTSFVSGSAQSLRDGSFFFRLYSYLRALVGSVNSSASGQRWRGRAKGLSNEEISNYAKELVEFEAACSRRLLLERVENEANFTMRRVAADSNRKQGMQEKRITQLSEQLKFWQYMVHNFHDHETELIRTTKELEQALDELDGITSDNVGALTSDGTIDFLKTAHQTVNRTLGRQTENTDALTPAADTSCTRDPPASHYREDEAGGCGTRKPPKILRRRAPLPLQSREADELVEAGHPALRGTDVRISETTRSAFLHVQVKERMWREPPIPPGEKGSWLEVGRAMEAGESVGAPLTTDELQRLMTFEEMLNTLLVKFPIDDPPSEEHRSKRDAALDMQTMTIVENDVDMVLLKNSMSGG